MSYALGDFSSCLGWVAIGDLGEEEFGLMEVSVAAMVARYLHTTDLLPLLFFPNIPGSGVILLLPYPKKRKLKGFVPPSAETSGSIQKSLAAMKFLQCPFRRENLAFPFLALTQECREAKMHHG